MKKRMTLKLNNERSQHSLVAYFLNPLMILFFLPPFSCQIPPIPSASQNSPTNSSPAPFVPAQCYVPFPARALIPFSP